MKDTSMQFWVEAKHEQLCNTCRAGHPCNARKVRVRVAQFMYLLEAIDYCQAVQKRGVESFLRKPVYVNMNGKTKSEYSHYKADGTVAL